MTTQVNYTPVLDSRKKAHRLNLSESQPSKTILIESNIKTSMKYASSSGALRAQLWTWKLEKPKTKAITAVIRPDQFRHLLLQSARSWATKSGVKIAQAVQERNSRACNPAAGYVWMTHPRLSAAESVKHNIARICNCSFEMSWLATST